ncbi:MAG: peptidoglycan DL-endopeptidase CwlO [Peptostreptococcaceae bacterium]|jgi:cell wall-associated NlpC family hydrolase|nr:peptidoglycan DL-endopeptidase CwlO [Peptostreptococcaceae bacterium]
MIKISKEIKRKLLQNRIYLFSLAALVCLLGFLVYYQPGVGYEVKLNGKHVGFVKRVSHVEKMMTQLDTELRESKGKDITYEANLEYNKGKLNGNDLTEQEDMKLSAMSALEIKSPGYLIKSDGKVLMAVKDEKTAQNILDAIKAPFVASKQNAKVEFVQEVNLVKAEKINIEKILNSYQALAIVKSPTSASTVSRSSVSREIPETEVAEEGKPLIDVKVTYQDNVNLPIYKAEQRVADSALTEGTTKVKSEGTNGVKEVVREVVEINGEAVEKTVISETVVEPSSPKIVAYGTKPKVSGVVAIAKDYIGVPYKWGGTTPKGFDCSGFTQYVFRKAGVSLPRTSAAQGKVGTKVSRSELRAGDLVMFPGHVGIYIGSGKFIHSPSPGKSVRIDDLSTRKNFLYGRRVN